MPTINEYKIDNYLNKAELQFQQDTQIQIKSNSKISDYFDYIYSYPPKIQIKWDGLDELNGDLFLEANYSVEEHSFPFLDFIEDWFFPERAEEAMSEKYSLSHYFDGFLDNVNSSNFFLKKTKQIQTSLTNIPIFVVLNGQGEIILSRPGNVLKQNSLRNFLNEKVYDSCGAFDSTVEKKGALGLFFMTRLDAENYLKEVARSDFEGTETLGLSIHCVNLSTAYKITREDHPGIDFRFVPNLQEIKNLLISKIGKSDMIVDDEQQQLRFRRRTMNLFPYLNRLGQCLSPTSSFLHQDEYFKGVPIYVVQLKNKQRDFFSERYFNFIGSLDTVYNGCLQFFDSKFGFGHNWIMQGSLQTSGSLEDFENYIFFEKEQALNFVKKYGRYVSRYSGGRSSNLEFAVHKPKVFVYNLEDFIEDWEDQILNKTVEETGSESILFLTKEVNFISPSLNFSGIEDLDAEKEAFQQSFLKKLTQVLNLKARVLKRATGIFFATT